MFTSCQGNMSLSSMIFSSIFSKPLLRSLSSLYPITSFTEQITTSAKHVVILHRNTQDHIIPASFLFSFLILVTENSPHTHYVLSNTLSSTAMPNTTSPLQHHSFRLFKYVSHALTFFCIPRHLFTQQNSIIIPHSLT